MSALCVPSASLGSPAVPPLHAPTTAPEGQRLRPPGGGCALDRSRIDQLVRIWARLRRDRLASASREIEDETSQAHDDPGDQPGHLDGAEIDGGKRVGANAQEVRQ